MDANSGEPWSEMDTGLPGPATHKDLEASCPTATFLTNEWTPRSGAVGTVGLGGAPELPRGPRQERSRQASVQSRWVSDRRFREWNGNAFAQIAGPCAPWGCNSRRACRLLVSACRRRRRRRKMRKGALRAARDVAGGRSETASETDGVYF